ncbi:MAG: hypothetical protein NTV79_01910 [Candidatus Aureabacteria bacterium]|nr:hypothetical protein [Candidatus Auribacterota bacterium]
MFPSWMRSRKESPRLVYFLAIEITNLKLASTISPLAFRTSRIASLSSRKQTRNSSTGMHRFPSILFNFRRSFLIRGRILARREPLRLSDSSCR